MAWKRLLNLRGPAGTTEANAKFDALELKDSQQDGRLGSIEAKNTTQDGRLTSVEAKNTEQDGRLDGVESKNTVQDGRLATVESENTVQEGRLDGVESKNTVQDGRLSELEPQTPDIDSSAYAIPFVSSNGGFAGGIKPDTTVVFPRRAYTLENAIAMANAQLSLTQSRKDRLAVAGDSLSSGYASGVEWPPEESWPGKLAAKLPNVAVFNRGMRGYTVDEISIAIGALKLNLSLDGGTMPASGSVGVSTTQNIGWLMAGNYRGIRGSIAGVPGILEKDLSLTQFTFTRDADGTSFPVAGTRVFEPEWDVHRWDSVIIFIGRNDVNLSVRANDPTVVDHVVLGTQRIVDYLLPQVKQVLLCGTITTTDEVLGTVGYSTVAQINRRLELLYGGRFIDVQDYLVNRCIFDLGLTPTPEDEQKMAGRTLPPSIMGPGDNTHFGKPAAAALAENLIYPFLTQRGWVM